MSARPRIVAWLAAVFLSACVPAEGGFRDLDRTLSQRIGHEVRAPRSIHDDHGAMDPAVRERLARPLDADGAMRVAVANNRDLRASLASLGVTAGMLLQASLAPNPNASLQYRLPLGAAAQSVGPFWDAEAGIDLRALILLPTNRAAAVAQFDAARSLLAARTIDTAFDARVSFYRYQAAAQTVEMLRTALNATGASLAAARALAAAGNIPPLDVAQQEALYEETRLQLVSAENDERQSRERMNVTMGLWGLETYWSAQARMPEPPASEPPMETIEADAVERSLVLEATRRRIDAARTRLGLARVAGAIPALDVGVAAARESGHDFLGPSVRVGIPLFDQGQGMAAVRRAELQREEARYIATAVRLRAQTRAAREQLLFARNRVEWFRTVQLPLRQRIVEQSLLQYNAMQIGVFQLLQARRDQIHAGREFIDALRDYWIARASLSRLLAGGSPRGEAETGSMDIAEIEGSAP